MRSSAFGKKVPPVTIEHEGTTYTFNLAITEGVLTEIEARLYERAIARLIPMKDALGPDEYHKRLDHVREQHESGEFDVMQSKAVQTFLKTSGGAMFLLAIMGGITEKQLIPLFAAKKDELIEVVKSALSISLPKGQGRAKRVRLHPAN